MYNTDVDLFGDPILTRTDASRDHRKTEVFDLAADLSPGERLVIGSYLADVGIETMKKQVKKGAQIFYEAERYVNCGQEAVALDCPRCRTGYFTKMFCKSRICERCGRIYKKELQKSMLPILKKLHGHKRKGYFLSMLTLTVKTDRFKGELPTRAHIERLYKESSLFFRLNYGKYKCRMTKSGKVAEVKRRKKNIQEGEDPRVFIGAGWFATMEIGKDNNNAHIHAVVYGPYRKWFALKSWWEKITGDSNGVDIRPVRSAKEVSDYVLKYITKPPVSDSYERIADYAIMIKGTRRLRSGGIFYNRFKKLKRDKPKCNCIYCHHRLVMNDIKPLISCEGDRIDLYEELRRIEQVQPADVDPLEVNFLPPGVTPVTLPLWQ